MRALHTETVEAEVGHHEAVAYTQSSAALAYSSRKLRSASLAVAVLALPLFLFAFAQSFAMRLVGIGLLLLCVLLLERLRRRAEARTCAVIVSAWGITWAATGLQLRWQDIARIHPVCSRSAKAIDVELRWPRSFARHESLSVRFGAWCQHALNVPAITLSLWLVEANAETFLSAVRAHRPDLLHHTNR